MACPEIQSFRGEATLLRVDRVEHDDGRGDRRRCSTKPEAPSTRRWCRAAGRSSRSSIATGRASAARSLRSAPSSMGASASWMRPVHRLPRGTGWPARPRSLGRRRQRLPRRRDATARDGRAASHVAARRGSTWVTRPRPHIDRIASAWLIKRFCDPDAKVCVCRRRRCRPEGHSLRVLGADFGHHGETARSRRCSSASGSRTGGIKLIAENRPRGGPSTTASSRGTSRRASTWPSARSPRPRRTITSARIAAWRSSTASTRS